MEVRAPAITVLRMSLPRLSVPSGWPAEPGGASWAVMSIAAGSYGVHTKDTNPAAAKRVNRAMPAMRLGVTRAGVRCSRGAFSSMRASLLGVPNSRVQQAVRDIHEEV